MTRVAIAGSTGSIGTQALDVVAASDGALEVSFIGARSSVGLLAAQARAHRPAVVGLFDPSRAGELAPLLPPGCSLVCGGEAYAASAEATDVVLNGVVGFAGLEVTLAALAGGRVLALANKESLVAGGPVVAAARAASGAEIVPVDSEHCAVHQCLRAGGRDEVARIVLTASGGPFFGRSAKDLEGATRAEALAHPTWKMGEKITVDSSTLMNKGLEVIEAHELFGLSYDEIDVVVHPQSVVHSMVEFADGATLAQLSLPDMRLAIGYAIAHPKRLAHPFGRIDWASLERLEFHEPDTATFPCLRLAYEAGRTGGGAPAWLNAANEVAVAAFLDGRIAWGDIARIAAACLEGHDGAPLNDVEDVLEADRSARRLADKVLSELGCPV